MAKLYEMLTDAKELGAITQDLLLDGYSVTWRLSDPKLELIVKKEFIKLHGVFTHKYAFSIEDMIQGEQHISGQYIAQTVDMQYESTESEELNKLKEARKKKK